MSRAVISVEKLGKEYVIGGRDNGRETFREMLVSAAAAPFRRLKRLGGNVVPEERIWALKDVSFEVKEGEVVGIIGRNGAGKSTLLKILSRITAPTEGRVKIRGRVSSLLEVGTGFHPELTGRENIYLNGAILGMSRAEIDRKFDDIVDFCGVEKFLDTPVKRYSSGMYVRLAFAVAAHLEPEILIVDEVLAVGDAEFQRKCLGKMEAMAGHGRTVIFVSHNMAAICLLCPSAIYLDRGRLTAQGQTSAVVGNYLSGSEPSVSERIWQFSHAPSTDVVRLQAVRVLGEHGQVRSTFELREPIVIQTDFWVLRGERLSVSIWLYDSLGIHVFASASYQDCDWDERQFGPGSYSARCTIPADLLNAGKYRIKVFLTKGSSDNQIVIDHIVSFSVEDVSDNRSDYTGLWAGVVRPLLKWNSERKGPLPLETQQTMERLCR